MYKIAIDERVLHFKQPAGTSRGVYKERKSWFVHVSNGSVVGTGECAPLPDLSCDARPDYAEVLRSFCDELEQTGEVPYEEMRDYPSMLFGLETALLDVKRKMEKAYYSTPPSAAAKSVFPLTVWCGWAVTTRCSSVWSRNWNRASAA